MDAAPPVPLAAVEWRVDSKPSERDGKNTCRFVPYLDALWVRETLDSWAGLGNWQDEYRPVTIGQNVGLECRISVLVGDRWVTRADAGTPSSSDPVKGAYTDAFKRCASRRWGIGVNVYDIPTLYAHCRVDNRGNAWPDGDKTIADINKQLKNRGFADAEGGKATVDAPPEPPPFDVDRFRMACAQQDVDPADVLAYAEIKRPLEQLTDEDRPALKEALAAVAAKNTEAAPAA